jgi:hypothetical protein
MGFRCGVLHFQLTLNLLEPRLGRQLRHTRQDSSYCRATHQLGPYLRWLYDTAPAQSAHRDKAHIKVRACCTSKDCSCINVTPAFRTPGTMLEVSPRASQKNVNISMSYRRTHQRYPYFQEHPASNHRQNRPVRMSDLFSVPLT